VLSIRRKRRATQFAIGVCQSAKAWIEEERPYTTAPFPESKRDVNWRGAVGSGSFAVGAIELADGFGTNEPGTYILRFRILFGSAVQLEGLLSAAKRALYFDVSAFRQRGSEISELAENHNAMPLGVGFPFIRLFVFPALLCRQAEHGEIRAVVLSGFDFSVFSYETN
jgi:hypothetical protein